jgi:circadian clock protein KaiB
MILFGAEQPRRSEEKGPFVFRLYVVDEGPSSARAIANLSAICKTHLPDNHQIEIVDILEDPRRVLSDHILATPTLIKLSPAPIRKIIGDLGEEAKVLLAFWRGTLLSSPSFICRASSLGWRNLLQRIPVECQAVLHEGAVRQPMAERQTAA